MKSILKSAESLLMVGLLLGAFLFCPPSATSQTYPDRPITIYCGFQPGATTDLTTRALAAGTEKLLGAPVVVENKPGGGATVAPALLINKKPDGYTLCVIPTGSLTARPHLLKLAYNPLKDFTYLVEYSRYVGGLCVLTESPTKRIDEFISYAKDHPGLSYSSAGMYTQQHLAVELFAKCKGLTFKHVPTKGGAELNTLLLGKSVDFLAGSGSHLPFVKQGLFRILLLYNTDRRDPNYPDIPMQRELGCQDVPPYGYLVIGPKGIPEPISKRLVETFKKVIEGPEFQKMLTYASLPYGYKEQAQLEMEIPAQFEWFKEFYKEFGAKREE
jgi:tripartite-type tricarboxylate transporter receptor subunit TctC